MHLNMPGTETILVLADKNKGTNTDTCIINKIRTFVGVFGERKREEMEINLLQNSSTSFKNKLKSS